MIKNIRPLVALILCVLLLCACDVHPSTTGSALPAGSTTMPAESTAAADAWQEYTLTRFLTETNHSGALLPSESDLTAPGTLPAVARIPAADQTMIGETVTVVLAQEQQAIPFYYSCDAATGKERLVFVITADKFPLLIIAEPQLGGLQGLCEAMLQEKPFPVKILAVVNISYEEGIYAYNSGKKTEGLTQQEYINIQQPSAHYGQFAGIYGTEYDGSPVCILKGCDTQPCSDALQQTFDVYSRIFERFSVTELFN